MQARKRAVATMHIVLTHIKHGCASVNLDAGNVCSYVAEVLAAQRQIGKKKSNGNKKNVDTQTETWDNKLSERKQRNGATPMATPTPEQIRRTHVRAWLSQYATPTAILALYDSIDCTSADGMMLTQIYRNLTGANVPNTEKRTGIR